MKNSILKLAYNLNLRVHAKNLLVQRNKLVQEGKVLDISQNMLNKKNQESLSFQSFKEGLSLLNINQEQAKIAFLKVLEDKNDLVYEENTILAQSSLELAKVYFEERNFKKAQKYLEKSFKLASATKANQLISDIYYHLGICMLTKDKQLAAQNYFKNYLEIAGEGKNGEKSLVQKELARILLKKQETKDVELMLSHALNYFKGQQNSINFFHEAECYQLLGEYHLLAKDYDKMLQNNAKCSSLVQRKKKDIEGDFENLYLSLAKSFLTAGQELMKEDEEKALNFLWNSLENFNKLGSEETAENSWVQAEILVSALEVLSKRRDHNECRNILGRLESESFTRQDFQSDKSYRDYLVSLIRSEIRLGLFEDAYGVIKSNAKYFNLKTTSKSVMTNFNHLWARLAYENDHFEESLEKQSLLGEERNLESYSISLKCYTKLEKTADFLDAVKRWKSLLVVNNIESQVVQTEITGLFSFFVQNAQYKLCEAFLLEISQGKGLGSQAMKLVCTYLSILSSKKSDFVKANLYLQMAQRDNSSYSAKSSSSTILLNKVMESSTIIKDCHQGLANLLAKQDKDSSRYLNHLWSLCFKHLEKSELQTAHILLKEIRRLLAIHGDSAMQNKFKLLDILIDIEVGKLEDAANLLKDAIERMRAYEYGDFTPLMYFLYGDTLKDLNSSGEAMVMWIKAVNTYMKMKAQKSCKIASKNALLFENLMSDRSDLLPELYKETVEKHFKC